MLIQPVQYSITLDTNEQIEVFELDSDRETVLLNELIIKSLEHVLEHCSYVTRKSIENAKKLFSKELSELLRTPPIGILIKLNMECSQINDCPMSSHKECSTKNVTKKHGRFPICWTYEIKTALSDTETIMANDLANHIFQAWRSGTYVLIAK